MKPRLKDKEFKPIFEELAQVDQTMMLSLSQVRYRAELLELASGHERVAALLRKIHAATED